MAVLPFSTSTSYALVGTNVGPFGTVWPYEHRADVQAWLTLPPAAAVRLTSGPDYALADVTPITDGGLITLSAGLAGAAWPAGAVLTLKRNTSNDQPSSYGEAGVFSPKSSEDALDHVERQVQDLRTAIAELDVSGGGGGDSAWASLTGVPAAISVIAALGAPSAGKVIEFTSAASAHYIATPNAGGSMQPRELSAFGTVDDTGANPTTNDPVIAAAEAAADSAVYLRDGQFAKSAATPAFSDLTKGYRGRGTWLEGTSVLPARFSYMAVKPTTAATQGLTGWFAGDQRFTEQDYGIIGPGVREFDLAARYYESNTIRRNAWLDVRSGNSGCQAFLTSGVAAGQTLVPLAAAADASWVGKTVAFANSYGGAVVETKTVAAVNTAGNNITVDSALANTYTWNPGAGLAPSIFFAPRTWGGHDYMKLTATGGGDHYGHNIRMNANYARKATEKHTFQAGTYSQYGGDVYANADGLMLQNWESQLQAQTYEVGAIGFVNSFVRNKDHDLDGGRFWGGTWFQSGGARPADVAHTVLGAWRNAFDTVYASLYETTRLTADGLAGTSTFTVATTNGAHPNDPVVFGSEALTIQNVVSQTQFTTTTPCVGSYVTGDLVTFSHGGAFANLNKFQRLIFNSTLDANQRGGDPLGVFSTFYGNKQGDIIMEGGTDGSSDFWSVRFARGTTAALPDTARIRLRPTGVNFYGAAHTFTGDVGLTSSSSLNLSLASGAKLTLGTGIWIEIQGGVAVITNNGGGSFAAI